MGPLQRPTATALVVGATIVLMTSLATGSSEAEWSAVGQALGMDAGQLAKLKENVQTVDALANLDTSGVKALRLNLGKRNRLKVWSAQYNEPAKPECLHASGSWCDDVIIEEYNINDPNIEAILANRTQHSGPMVIRKALAGNQEFLAWGDMKAVVRSQDPNFAFDNVKVGKQPNMIYWKQSINWMGWSREQREGGQLDEHIRPQHQWKYMNVPAKDFLAAFYHRDPPHLYMLEKLPKDTPMGITRGELCKRFAAWSDLCDGPESPGFSVWGNSNGVVGQAHYDLESVIFAQLQGIKKFTFWHPASLPKMCLYPYVYPGNAQSQIDMGDNLGAKYYRKCRHPVQHNRSVSLESGDILLIPPFYMHRIDAPTATTSMGYNFESPQSKGQGAMYTAVLTPLKRICEWKKPRASAATRVLLRRIFARLLGKDQVKPMLVDHWEDFEMMLERKMFGQATEEGVQKLCAQEAKLPPKVDKWLDRHAEKIANVPITHWPKVYAPQACKSAMGMAMVMMLGLVEQFPTKPTFGADQIHTWYQALTQCKGVHPKKSEL